MNNMKNEIPSAEDFLSNYEQEYFQGDVYGSSAYMTEEVIKAMKEFAKLHVKAALEKASKCKPINYSLDYPGQKQTVSYRVDLLKKHILDSYPEDLIK